MSAFGKDPQELKGHGLHCSPWVWLRIAAMPGGVPITIWTSVLTNVERPPCMDVGCVDSPAA